MADIPLKANSVANDTGHIVVDSSRIVSMTAESDALAVATVANWLDVQPWRRIILPAEGQNLPNQLDNFASVKEFDLEILCDAAETVTSMSLYGVRPQPLVVADDTFTATAADPSVVTATAHTLLMGDGPFRVSSSTTLPAGLVADTDYWIFYLDANTYSWCPTRADALAGTNKVACTTTGTGTHTISDKVVATEADDDDITQRLHFFLYGTINAGNDVVVGAQTAYIERIQHSPLTLYYAILGTQTSAEPTWFSNVQSWSLK